MAKTHRGTSAQRTCDKVTVSHRGRLIEELRADPKLAADYFHAAVKDGDARVYLAAREREGRIPSRFSRGARCVGSERSPFCKAHDARPGIGPGDSC